MQRTPLWTRPAVPGHNPTQTDRNQAILPGGLPGIDPFLFLMEDWFSKTGFDWHPHRGFETVTYVIDGVLEHKDNTGAHGVLRAGDLQWTTTGKGVLHTEIAHERKGVHTLQLWLNLPASKKMSDPTYQDLRGAKAPIVGLGKGIEVPVTAAGLDLAALADVRADIPSGDHGRNVVARVFAGVQHGIQGPAQLLHPAGVTDMHFGVDGRYTWQLPGDHFGFFYVISGQVRVGDQVIPAGHAAGFHPSGEPGDGGDDHVDIISDAEAHVIAYHGLPIREPVAQHGPFVMNSRDEIIQTVRDYQSGAFGQIPS